jgi:hypothetical protein
MLTSQGQDVRRAAARALTLNHSRAVARALTLNHSRAVARALTLNHSRAVAVPGRSSRAGLGRAGDRDH